MKEEILDWEPYRKWMDSLTVPRDFCERIIIHTQRINLSNGIDCPDIKPT